MGSVAPLPRRIPGTISDAIDRLLLSAQEAGVPIIDVQLEAERLFAVWPDQHFGRDEIASAILTKCMNHSGIGVVMASRAVEAGKKI